mmetsp:Transcript_2097/g.7252  ORF Transcript_2097/g.7252 Transcript_2097/m.7252 type:complete len:201 (+) Transcript_2097:201-803(+)
MTRRRSRTSLPLYDRYFPMFSVSAGGRASLHFLCFPPIPFSVSPKPPSLRSSAPRSKSFSNSEPPTSRSSISTRSETSQRNESLVASLHQTGCSSACGAVGRWDGFVSTKLFTKSAASRDTAFSFGVLPEKCQGLVRSNAEAGFGKGPRLYLFQTGCTAAQNVLVAFVPPPERVLPPGKAVVQQAPQAEQINRTGLPAAE